MFDLFIEVVAYYGILQAAPFDWDYPETGTQLTQYNNMRGMEGQRRNFVHVDYNEGGVWGVSRSMCVFCGEWTTSTRSMEYHADHSIARRMVATGCLGATTRVAHGRVPYCGMYGCVSAELYFCRNHRSYHLQSERQSEDVCNGRVCYSSYDGYHSLTCDGHDDDGYSEDYDDDDVMLDGHYLIRCPTCQGENTRIDYITELWMCDCSTVPTNPIEEMAL